MLLEESLEIVIHFFHNGKNYHLPSEQVNVSYQWVKKLEKEGADVLKTSAAGLRKS